MNKLLIVGAGGHGKVVADTALATGRWQEIAFLDDRYPKEPVCGLPVIGSLAAAKDLIGEFQYIVVAIGNNARRIQLLHSYVELGFEVATIVHPKACVSKFADIQRGTVAFASSVINAGASLGEGCIINTGATVDHDSVLGYGVHISPGANIAGGAIIGNLSHIGIGASVIEQVNIGSNVLLGAGSVAIRDIESGTKVVGVPARVIERNT